MRLSSFRAMNALLTRSMSAFLIVVGMSGAASAGLINISTGLDATDTLLTANGQLDAHWTASSPGGGAAAQAIYPGGPDWYGGWLANGPSSTWIARDFSTPANGTGDYNRSIDLTGWDLSSVVIAGSWSIDDSGDLLMNGNVVASLGAGNWGTLIPFSIPSGYLVAGINTLTMRITSSDNFLEAVRLEGHVEGRLSGVPEPSTLVSSFVGATLLIGLVRRGRKRA